MPKCNGCRKNINVDKKPGALFFSSPNEDGYCWKAHLCKECEAWHLARFQIQPELDTEKEDVEE